MIIVSQDKNEIVNFENITSIVVNDVWEDRPGQVLNATDVRGSRHSLGYYKDEERAKEVLQEIYCKYEHGIHLLSGKSLSFQNIMDYDFIYEMPKE